MAAESASVKSPSVMAGICLVGLISRQLAGGLPGTTGTTGISS